MVFFKVDRLVHVLVALQFVFVFITPVTPSQWLSLALTSSVSSFSSRKSCDDFDNHLSYKQVQVCKRNVDVMNSVKFGATIAVQECQHQFRYRRWNCTTLQFEKSPVFGNSANGGTREAAFVHSISSAGVAYAVTHSCSAGKLGRKCGCDQKYTGEAEEGWKWAGCSDDIEYGIEFSTKFVDARERGRTGNPARIMMNLHNNMAGRLALRKFVQIPCKCHGVSGSCNVKTCWRSLPNFRKVGEHIKEKFDGATEVQYQRIGSKSVLVPRNPEYKPYTKYDLVYLNGSPDFCSADPSTGSLGTQGRFCNRTSQAIEGCAFMCCNRGFTTHLEHRVDRCNCKFFWCCYVKCSECHKRVEVSICK
ncbi:unnamed protein product [Porites evermanni]|uniref:Protein Wnt n=1 Tax=Porites evermanni TaxID=104178 RepID=A0ABN8PZN9_9CNID|nr:unnamed protein product [Porites evermanni]